MKEDTTTIRVSIELRNELKELAAKKRKSLLELTNGAIKTFISKQSKSK